jgi:monoterpene epsilon-lactone hydrolase
MAQVELADLRGVRFDPIVEGFRAGRADCGGVPAEVVYPEDPPAEPGRTILYFHGGGYLTGSPDQYRGATVPLARAARAVVWVPDYRWAPEHPFPAAHDDALAAYRGLLKDGVDAASLAVAGDSAGAALALSVLAAARDAGLPLASCALLNSPYADLTASSPSLDDPHYNQGRVRKDRVVWMMEIYLSANNADPRDPRHSPVFADLTGLPPILVQAGGRDPLHDDGIRVAARAKECGVDVTLTEYPASEHIWVVAGTRPAPDPEAERAALEAARFITEHIR